VGQLSCETISGFSLQRSHQTGGTMDHLTTDRDPLTHEIMADPVICNDNGIYDRFTIIKRLLEEPSGFISEATNKKITRIKNDAKFSRQLIHIDHPEIAAKCEQKRAEFRNSIKMDILEQRHHFISRKLGFLTQFDPQADTYVGLMRFMNDIGLLEEYDICDLASSKLYKDWVLLGDNPVVSPLGQKKALMEHLLQQFKNYDAKSPNKKCADLLKRWISCKDSPELSKYFTQVYEAIMASKRVPKDFWSSNAGLSSYQELLEHRDDTVVGKVFNHIAMTLPTN
jgi:hypothetical protein